VREFDPEEGDGAALIDLCNLLPDNFNEIPYLTQINIKKKAMESLNNELEKLVKRQTDEVALLVKLNKDYSPIFNVIVHMLEDPNMLVFIEAIKTIDHLCNLLKSSIKSTKMKQFVQLLADKYKETKTAVLV